MNCNQKDEEQQENLRKLNHLLNQSEEILNKQIEKVENTILVLGNPGSGKTTFVQFMAGDNSKLFAKKPGNNTHEFLIYGDKIGSSVTESTTLSPEQITGATNISFTDTPGFCDTRSEIHEVIASHGMKRYLQDIHSVKIVLLVQYYSLKQGTYKDDFIELLNNVNNFIKDINKYKNSIVLIATKVPKELDEEADQLTILTDDKIIAEIGEYLFKVRQSLTEKLTDTNEDYKKQFLKNAITILQSLGEIDNNGNFKRINIFRRPASSGTLSENSDFQNSKKSLQRTIYENVVYSKISNSDIEYTLSFRAKMYLNCLLQNINENIIKISKNIFDVIDLHYKKKLKNYVDIYTLNKQRELLLKESETLHNELKKVKNLEDYITRLKEFIRKQDIKEVDDRMLNKFNTIQNDANNILPYTTNHQIFSALIWSEQMRFLLNNIEESVSWSKFLVELFDHFSSFNVQKTRNEFLNSTVITKTNDTLKLILSHFDSSLYDNFNNFNNIMSDESKLGDLKEIVSMTLEDQNRVECSQDGKFTLVGNYVKISTISRHDTLKRLCKGSLIKTIVIYAMHTVFIDADIIDEDYKGISLLILSPNWEIIGSRVINLDGINGKTHTEIKAKSGAMFWEQGKDGEPGLPGENGGNFLGIAIQFKNDENLVVSVNGGIGGVGQHGGDGYNGQNGKDGSEKFYLDQPTTSNAFSFLDKGYKTFPYGNKLKSSSKQISNLNMYDDSSEIELDIMRTTVYNDYYCATNVSVYTKYGDCGTLGERGGNGGSGGIGGNSGNILVIGKNGESNFVINNSSGVSGPNGTGGVGGSRGPTGKPITCFNSLIQLNRSDYSDYRNPQTYKKNDFWTCKNWYLIEPENKCNESDKAEDGMSGFVQEGIIEPKITASFDFSPELYNYISLLKKLENNKYLITHIKDIQNLIYDKVFSKTSNFWKFILVPQAKNN